MAALRISLKGVSVERAENLVDQIQEVLLETYIVAMLCLCYSSYSLVWIWNKVFFFFYFCIVV